MSNSEKTSIHISAIDHLKIVFKYVLHDYLDNEDKCRILSCDKVEDFDIADLLSVNIHIDSDYALRHASENGHL